MTERMTDNRHSGTDTDARTDTRTDTDAHADARTHTTPHPSRDERAGAGPTIALTVNGAPRRVAAGLTLDALVATLTTAPRGVAAAVNEDVVPRGSWPTTTLGDGDRVEVLTAVQGG